MASADATMADQVQIPIEIADDEPVKEASDAARSALRSLETMKQNAIKRNGVDGHHWGHFTPLMIDGQAGFKCDHCSYTCKTISNPLACQKSHLGSRSCSPAGEEAAKVI
jgi:hypothetical protein